LLLSLGLLTGPGDEALIVDEIYLGLTYDGIERSAARWDDVFVINSFSKYFQMTGWRLGWLVAPSWAIEGLERLARNLFLAAPTPARHAALATFHPDTLSLLEARKTELKTRRDFSPARIARARLRRSCRTAGCLLPVCRLPPPHPGQR
jgi:aspartate/methionine/tyrosine aminotransferase